MNRNRKFSRWKPCLTALLVLVSSVLTAGILQGLLYRDALGKAGSAEPIRMRFMEKLDMIANNAVSDALEGVLAMEKVYWLNESDLVAPEPDPDNFGQTQDPEDLRQVIENAQVLLAGQQTVFGPGTRIRKDSTITYYLDETILCITWQHTVGTTVYTCSEVKIAHPSQFRRFLTEGEFGSGKLRKATEMAASVNAVTASNGDYYAFRNYGNLVYNGEVKRSGNTYLDTCYIDENGDLIMVDYFKLYKDADVKAFVEENKIRFSLAFGPIMIRDGKNVVKVEYPIGEVEEFYARSALCQIGPLHYMLVTVNSCRQDLYHITKHLLSLGVQQAYMIDGGQTATIVTNDKLMNPVEYGGERDTSDIIYFATALPGGGG